MKTIGCSEYTRADIVKKLKQEKMWRLQVWGLVGLALVQLGRHKISGGL